MLKHRVRVAALLSAMMMAHARVDAACTVGRIAELPVTMEEMGPMVDAKVNGTSVRFIADSGAFFSVISPGSAQALHLPVRGESSGFEIRGINGSAPAGFAQVKSFKIAGTEIPHAEFIVAGSEVQGIGVIGQDILGIGDAEYDLPHGAIRLMRATGCGKANLAYWATGRPFSVITIEPHSPQRLHTIGTVFVNGKPVRAIFDTGASTSMLSLSAAARAGIKPGGRGVVDGGNAWGVGRKLVRTWIAPVDTFAVGDGEQIQRARIRIGAMDIDADMLIGADFFIAHRVYVDNVNHRLFVTYEGGPVFNLKTRFDGPVANDGAPPADVAAAAKAGTTMAAAPVDADGYSRNGAVAMARHDVATAIADFSKAIAAAPGEPRYLDQRADAYLRKGDRALGRADLDRAIKLDPTDIDAFLTRAAMMLANRDRQGAIADLDAADHVADPAAMARLEIGGLLTEAGQFPDAVRQFDLWIKAHPDDVRGPSALNGRCWARARGGQGLDIALRDCNAALRARPGTASFLDSRGLVQLRRGDWAKALADYDTALAAEPKLAWSLYGRGLAKLHSGDATGANADIAAAIAIQPHIAEDAKGDGIL